MNINEKLHRYVDENGLYSKRGYISLNHRCEQIFQHVHGLDGKTMLEIGSGEGLFALWALADGIERAVLLEPEEDGSKKGVAGKFLEHRKALGIPDDRLKLFTQTFQEFEGKKESFDIVLSYASINHLDERACVQLDRSKSAKTTYLQIFEKVYDVLRSGGHFVINDAGRLNFWGLLGLRSPFAPTIDWEKHQEPVVWEGLLKKAGFEFVALDWHRFYPLRRLGWLGANCLVTRAITSQFVLTMCKP